MSADSNKDDANKAGDEREGLDFVRRIVEEVGGMSVVSPSTWAVRGAGLWNARR